MTLREDGNLSGADDRRPKESEEMMAGDERWPEEPYALTWERVDHLDEARRILNRARADAVDRPKPVSSSNELEHDPIQRPSGDNGLPDSGVNIVNSFVNRTVFFDYFRHVANKRFPEMHPKERVQALVQLEPGFYKRSIWSDYALKVTTTVIVVGLATALFFKAIFL